MANPSEVRARVVSAKNPEDGIMSYEVQALLEATAYEDYAFPVLANWEARTVAVLDRTMKDPVPSLYEPFLRDAIGDSDAVAGFCNAVDGGMRDLLVEFEDCMDVSIRRRRPACVDAANYARVRELIERLRGCTVFHYRHGKRYYPMLKCDRFEDFVIHFLPWDRVGMYRAMKGIAVDAPPRKRARCHVPLPERVDACTAEAQ